MVQGDEKEAGGSWKNGGVSVFSDELYVRRCYHYSKCASNEEEGGSCVSTKKPGPEFPPIRLRVVLIILFIIVGTVPILVQGSVITNAFRKTLLESRKAEIQNRSLILATKLSRAGYLGAGGVQDAALNTEMDVVAQSYSGRLLLIDQDYRILRDSFHLSEGRYHIAPEVIHGFRGENGTSYNEDKYYMIQTTPIYDSVDFGDGSGENAGRSVRGVLLFIASTESLRAELSGARSTLWIFNAIMMILLLSLSVYLSARIMRPFAELRVMLRKVSAGDLNQNIEQHSYVVTEQISTAINTTLHKLKSVDQSRDEFVSNVSHELKTPITSIRVLADSLMSMEDAPIELYKEFMNDISREIDREAKIIDDLLSLVKMERSAIVLSRKSTDIHAMLEQILKRLRPLARVNNIELTLETVREVSADVDEVKFSLAIMNLVENGIKYNVKDGWVKVSLDADHQFCYIKVEDSGIGIPENQQESVFERFFRVDKARSRETGGTGLGLAITKDIVLMHQGIVRLNSREGEGTTFLVRIPLTYIENSTPGSAAEKKG